MLANTYKECDLCTTYSVIELSVFLNENKCIFRLQGMPISPIGMRVDIIFF